MEYVLNGFAPKPKARPRSGKGRMFVPKEYTIWKHWLRQALAEFNPVPITGPLALGLEIRGPNRPRGDMDNLLGGVMDALQPPVSGDLRAQREYKATVPLELRLADAPGVLYADDSQVQEILFVRWRKHKHKALVITIEEMPWLEIRK